MKQHRVLIGDCIESMRTLKDQSVNTCVTSPPYYGLRDYGMDGQIGLEETPAEFVGRLVEVFREVRRVLRNDGTLWVNMGDTYASIAGGYAPGGSAGKHDMVSQATRGAVLRGKRRSPPIGLKQKDLMGIFPGASPSPFKMMAGTCAKTSFGTSRIRCQNPPGTGAQKRTSTCFS